MQIKCRMCGEGIPAEDINLDRMLAKCAHCHAVFEFTLTGPDGEGGVEVPPRPVALPKSDVALPRGMQVQRTAQELRLEQSWYRPSHLFLVPFCLFWNGALVAWYCMALSIQEPAWAIKVLFLLFPLLHVAVGLVLLYVCLTGLLNHTVIVVRRGVLSVRFVPIPCRGQVRLSVADIDQLYCSERQVIQRGREHVQLYDLMVQLRGGQTLTLLGGLETLAAARFIEQQVESYLHIVDRPMPDEVVDTEPPSRRHDS